jgi:hypothetical protein
MNSFYEHHKDSIHWHYRCFDRILLNGLIQPFRQPERVVGFFNSYRQTRSAVLPDVPTISEFVAGYEATGWQVLGVPKNTPIEIVSSLNNEIRPRQS